MSDALLPLFPLQIVLLPTAVVSLHIFEERYKQLINECVAEGKEFGISFQQDDEIAKVGCTAVVTDIAKRYHDGRLDILVRGHRRYKLESLVESPKLYSLGRVHFLARDPKPVDRKLAAETIKLHNQMIQIVYHNAELEVEVDEHNPLLSFRVAQKSGMDLAQRQALLEEDSENKRLKALHQYFIEVIPKLQHHSEVERIVKSDGYIP